jgi:hypothetical protein
MISPYEAKLVYLRLAKHQVRYWEDYQRDALPHNLQLSDRNISAQPVCGN